MGAQHHLIRGKVGAVLLLALACGCSFMDARSSGPIPSATLTEAEVRDIDNAAAYGALSEEARPGWLGKLGVRVARPVVRKDAGERWWLECPSEFPIAAAEYGRYFLPNDALYPVRGRGTAWLSLCFTTEDDAIQAGYVQDGVDGS